MVTSRIFKNLAMVLGVISIIGVSMTSNASAKSRVNVWLGIGLPAIGLYNHGYYNRHHYHRHHYHRHHYHRHHYHRHHYRRNYYRPKYHAPRRHRVSCSRAKRILRNHGYHRVRARDCRGNVYGFRARKHGRGYYIKVNSRTGRVISRSYR